jgi:hypothetical protein
LVEVKQKIDLALGIDPVECALGPIGDKIARGERLDTVEIAIASPPILVIACVEYRPATARPTCF